jgi:hypothetical protein
MVLFSLLLGLSVPDSAHAAGAFSGDWQGSWVSYYGGSGGLSVHIAQTGASIGGRLTIRNTECGNFPNLPLAGNVSNNIISIYANAVCAQDQSYNELEFTQGVLTNNTVSGVYTVISDGAFYDSGTFNLARSINLIDAGAGPGGTISPAGEVAVNAGADRTFTISPDTGYRILDVKVDGVSVGAASTYTFNNLSANHTIAATFEIAPNPPSPIVPNILEPLLLDGDR